MNKKFYLLRHGETEFNQLGIYQGTLDSPLTTNGKQQVKENGLLLKQNLRNVKDEEIAFFYSPLGRTQQSARIISEVTGRQQVRLMEDERLKEVDIGRWNGKNRQEIQKSDSTIDCDRYNWYFKSPNGESYADVFSRCKSWIETIQLIEQQHVIVMSHGLLGRVLRGVILDLSFEEAITLEISQTGFFILEEGRSKFVTNDYEYM